MRTLLLIITVATLFIPVTSWAEFPDNPDRFPSLGISLGLTGESGTSTVTAGGLSADQDISLGAADITADLRLPVSNSVTFFGAFSVLADQQKADETSQLVGIKNDSGGIALRLGARIYFNGR